jgi:hypothetical protein
VEPFAFDGRGALHYLWSEGTRLVLGRSVDRGATWTSSGIVEGGERLFFPYLIARGSGELVASWAAWSTDSGVAAGGELRARVAWITFRDDGPPEVLLAPPVRPAAWMASDTGPPVPDTAGEYFATAFLPDGGVAMVTPIQDQAASRMGFSFWRLVLR